MSLIGLDGTLADKVGSCVADVCLVTRLLAGETTEMATGHPTPARELYIQATIAQGVLEVSQGMQPSFRRRCHCREQGDAVPCHIEVAPHVVAGDLAGTLVTCCQELTNPAGEA